MTIAELNALDRGPFIETLGWIFEESPWVAERAWGSRPFADVDALHQQMTLVVSQAARDEQLALLRAHPDLGARARMSDASVGEQATAGLDRLSPRDVERLHALNSAYREKFAFPFLYAVKGSTPQQILDALEQRLPRAVDEEFAEALRQVGRIARFRLDQLITAL
jgi:2-oxo-4-hydroxy-4-carboxy-5-ureidoimidazoline decarboxylase